MVFGRDRNGTESPHYSTGEREPGGGRGENVDHVGTTDQERQREKPMKNVPHPTSETHTHTHTHKQKKLYIYLGKKTKKKK